MNVSQARIMRVGPVPVSVKTFFTGIPSGAVDIHFSPAQRNVNWTFRSDLPSLPGPSLTSTLNFFARNTEKKCSSPGPSITARAAYRLVSYLLAV